MPRHSPRQGVRSEEPASAEGGASPTARPKAHARSPTAAREECEARLEALGMKRGYIHGEKLNTGRVPAA